MIVKCRTREKGVIVSGNNDCKCRTRETGSFVSRNNDSRFRTRESLLSLGIMILSVESGRWGPL